MITNGFKIFLVLIFFSHGALAQYTRSISLSDAIELAKKNSLDAKILNNNVKFSYWDQRNYKASLLPKLSLNGTLPNYFKSVNSITLPNGEYNFVYQEIASSNLSLDLSQNVGLTGGKISMSTSLARLDNFRSTNNVPVSYSAIPYLVSYTQDSFFYNEFRWQNKISPLKYEEAKREYFEKLEAIVSTTIEHYFALLISQAQLKLDRSNVENLDTLLKITQVRVNRGTADVSTLIHAKLNLFDARKAMNNSELETEIARHNFITYLKLEKHENLDLIVPEDIAGVFIDPEEAITYAQNNRAITIGFVRRKLEAERDVAQTRAQTGPALSFRTDFGISKTASGLSNTYASTPLQRQSISIGISMPLLDWGVNKSNRKRAEAVLELEQSTIEQEKSIIEQEVFLEATRWNLMMKDMKLMRERRSLADEYYDIAKRKYVSGSMDLDEYHTAQLERNKAFLDYMNDLRDLWTSYSQLRRLSLYDFLNKRLLYSDNVFYDQ